eukprot:TRINITY_DN10276_c0_g1_i2.p1 TRINITY_DN10276_c0_g1~~TRINITY_DN10276_c0_g1_i2.p1  ORF type:complete len:270 (-),score=94.84 TRINITY_DN10276_c0_g1_i2:640-1449(-)
MSLEEVSSPASILAGFERALKTLNTKKREMSTSTHDLIRQLEKAYDLLDQRTRDLELAAHVGQTLLSSNTSLQEELQALRQKPPGCDAGASERAELEEQLDEQEHRAEQAESLVQKATAARMATQARLEQAELSLEESLEGSALLAQELAVSHKALRAATKEASTAQQLVQTLQAQAHDTQLQTQQQQQHREQDQAEARRAAKEASAAALRETQQQQREMRVAELALQDLTGEVSLGASASASAEVPPSWQGQGDSAWHCSERMTRKLQ